MPKTVKPSQTVTLTLTLDLAAFQRATRQSRCTPQELVEYWAKHGISLSDPESENFQAEMAECVRDEVDFPGSEVVPDGELVGAKGGAR